MNAPALFALQALLTGLDGSRVAVDSTQQQATVIVFSSTVCPVAGDYAPRLEKLWQTYGQRRGVRFLVVFPNQTESLDDLRRHAAEMRFPFPVFRDDGNTLADAVGARVTPSAAVVSREGAVRYLGAIDDAANPARVTRRFLNDALAATLAGRKPKVAAWEGYG